MVDKVEMNERYRLNNGYLVRDEYDGLNAYSDFATSVANLTNLNDYLALYNIPFAYIQTPHVFQTDDDPMIPWGYETNINGNTDRLLAELEENIVNYLDLRENVKEDNLNNYDLFFSTDHHWSFEVAFWAHEKIARYIDTLLGEKHFVEEYFDLENYTAEQVENNFLGSHGERTGVFFGGVDSMNLIIPKFKTEFLVQIPSIKWNVTGDFHKSMLDMSHLETNYEKYPYLVYLSAHTDFYSLKNKLVTNEKKILILKDSFSYPLASFLALHYSEVYLYQNIGDESSERFIEKLYEIQPDLILNIRAISNALSSNTIQGSLDYPINSSTTIELNQETTLDHIKLINWSGVEESFTWTTEASAIQFETDLNTDFTFTIDYAKNSMKERKQLFYSIKKKSLS